MIKYIAIFIASFTLCLILLGGAGVFAFPERANELSQELTDTANKGSDWVNNVTTAIGTAVYDTVSNTAAAVEDKTDNLYTAATDGLTDGIDGISNTLTTTANKTVFVFTSLGQIVSNGVDSVQASASNAMDTTLDMLAVVGDSISNTVEGTKITVIQAKNSVLSKMTTQNDTTNIADDDYVQVASLDEAIILAGIEPSAGGAGPNEEPPQIEYEFETEEDNIISEVVLVPREKTVISSSRDGKIKTINFANGDIFNKGDILLEYECADIRAEIDAAGFEQKLAGQKMLTTSRLYDLNIASKIDREQANVEKNIASAKQSIAQSKLDSCIIRAQFDGRVVKRLANPNEYTRTDRVLMEIASTGTLDAEFLMPSIWLRWINIGAPVNLVINETGRQYTGKISRIYGEVDPVSQSIQIRARLNNYEAPLLPGMSGQVNIDVNAVRDAGIRGFLETVN